MPTLKVLLLALAILAGLYGLDRLALWAERRGWLYWRKMKPTGNALGAMTLELQRIFESGKATHVLEAQRQSKQAAPDPGAGGPGPAAQP
jgi:hypothetical protein